MDIFEVHRWIVDDYANRIRSFDSIVDDVIRQRVEQHLDDGKLYQLCLDPEDPVLCPIFSRVGDIGDTPLEQLTEYAFAPKSGQNARLVLCPITT